MIPRIEGRLIYQQKALGLVVNDTYLTLQERIRAADFLVKHPEVTEYFKHGFGWGFTSHPQMWENDELASRINKVLERETGVKPPEGISGEKLRLFWSHHFSDNFDRYFGAHKEMLARIRSAPARGRH